MSDDLMGDITAAVSGVKFDDAPESPTPPGDAAQPSGEGRDQPPAQPPSEGARARDDAGRFTSKAEEVKTEAKSPFARATEKPGESKGAVTHANVPAPELAAPGSKIAPPANWKGAGKVAFAELPPTVQQAIADDYKALGEQQSRHSRLETVLTPERAQNFVAHYGSVEAGLNQLLTISEAAAKDKPGFIRWYAQQNGIDLAQLAGQGPAQPNGNGQAETPSPQEQRLARIETAFNQFVQQQTQSLQQPIMAEIDRFAASTEHPYFNDVWQKMTALLPRIQGSPVERLQRAYDEAVWATPEIRKSLLAAERKREQESETAKVAAARSAQVSLNGSPPGGKTPGDEPGNETIERTVSRAVNQALGH